MFGTNSLNFLTKNKAQLKNSLSTSSPHSICLLSSTQFNPYKFMERNFTITTNNSSGKFNKYLLSKTSSEILSFIKENPNDLQFHINIQDENKVIEKFEKLYQGETVEFNKNDISISSKIIDHLHLSINFVKHNFSSSTIINLTQKNKICTINIVQNLNEYIENSKSKFSFALFATENNNNIFNFINAIPEFTIQTKKRKYKCNSVGVQSSTVIRDLLSKNKNSNQYFYDFEDENEDFKIICDIFNFKRIELSRDNAEIIKEISEDLGIECVIDSIEKYFVELDKVSQAIDDQQKLIDRIDELFDFLYHIKEKTVETVSEFIYDSKWSKTEENVIELAAFILQVVNSNTLLHPYLIDLILKLNESDNNELKKLLPFVIKSVMLSFSKKINYQKCNSTELIYPFVFQLLKRGLINIKELSEKLKNFTNYKDTFFISWFLPEIIKFNPKMKDLVLKVDSDGKTVLYTDNVVVTLLYPCCPLEMEIENYLKLRDKGEYDNDIANALRKDDIDTFQSIITSSVENLLNKTIEPNIFEPFSIKKTNFLNYAAAYGSIKCFKYLILNDEKIDESTFDMAIIGGNNEIIRIVDNERIKQNQNQNHNQKGLRLLRNNVPKITYAIAEHKNDIFDWILEQNAEIKNGNNNLLPLVISSIENGNAHSLIQLIDNGFNFHNNLDKCPRLIEIASERGFYLLVKLLLKLINKNSNQGISIDPKSTVEFGNISIFMLFDKNMKQDHLETSLLCAISSNNMKIVKYFFEVLINQNFKLDSKNSLKILEDSVQHKSNEIFDYLIDKIENLCPIDPKLLFKVIKKAYKAKNVESAIKNIEIINNKSAYYDFSAAFSHALKENLKEIIQYFIDKKYQVNYDNIAENISDIASIDIDIFELLMNNVDSATQKVLKRYINKAIRDKNKPLIKYLLNQDSLLENSLIEAVRTNDLEIVDMILEKNSSPSYINQNFQSGTALYISVQSKRTEIFNRLIDIPGIDLNVYYKNFQTPLTLAASQLNENMFKSILKSYGKDIVNQKWQLERAAKSIIEEYSYQNTFIDVKIRMLSLIIDLKCINPNYCFTEDTLLTFACKAHATNIAESLLQYENIDPNIYSSETGDTPLITSIKYFNFDIFKLIFDHPKTNINQRNYEGKTALIYAIENEDIEIVDLLLENEKFNPEESNINLAFAISDEINISKKLLSFDCLDVNYDQYNNHIDESDIYLISETEKIYKSQLIRSILYDSNDLFDLIVQHPSFDKSQKQLRNAIYVALLENKIEMFKKILTMFTDIDINSHVFNGNSLLVEAIICKKNPETKTGKKQSNYIEFFFRFSREKNIKEEINFIQLLMNYPTFDSKKSDIAYAFTLYITKQRIDDNSTKIMNILYDYDCKHYHLIDSEIDKNGTNILISLINSYQTCNDFIKFLLERGVDVNKPDERGVYPLEEAIKNKKNNLVLFLISTNKIDFNQKIHDKSQNEKFTTYLHLAVTNNLVDVINEIVSNHLCDINITNDLGETPLMEACREKKIDCVNTLFKYEDLDFTHKNNKGEDAIQMSKNLFVANDEKIDIKDDINNKDEYLSALLKVLNLKQQRKTNRFRMLNH